MEDKELIERLVETEYNPKMTIETAYEYLKTTEKYKNAENV